MLIGSNEYARSILMRHETYFYQQSVETTRFLIATIVGEERAIVVRRGSCEVLSDHFDKRQEKTSRNTEVKRETKMGRHYESSS
jgi:hypothetical protein